ncbi:MAG: hypothetical protein ACP5EP_11055 [Acidobacteriaceae bacterium]
MAPTGPFVARAIVLLFSLSAVVPAVAKVHSVALGAPRTVPYTAPTLSTKTAESAPGTLRVRPLVVDGRVLEWCAGEVHEVTDRSFVVRRAVRLNDALPSEHGAHWIWTLGPWLLVDRMTAHITVLRLPDFDPAVSQATWFRDYAAYCGINSTGKHLYAVVAQLGVRRPLVARALGKWTADDHPTPVCAASTWQRQPLQVTFHPTDGDAVSFQLLGLTSALIEGGESSDDNGVQ